MPYPSVFLLCSLPPEDWFCLVEYLTDQDLTALASTCKRFRDHCEEVRITLSGRATRLRNVDILERRLIDKGYKEAIQRDYTASLVEGYNAGFQETFHSELHNSTLNGRLFALSLDNEELQIVNSSRNRNRLSLDPQSEGHFSRDDVEAILSEFELDHDLIASD